MVNESYREHPIIKEVYTINKNMSDEEKEEQRRSFAYGNLAVENPNITRSLIDKVADNMKNK